MQAHGTQAARTFTIGFDHPEHDESAHARAVAAHLGTEHTELRVTGSDALALVPSLSRIFDEPLADPSQIPTFLVSQLARRQVTVALSGDGGDELFAGYNRHTTGMTLLPRLGRVPRIPRRLLGGMLRMLPASAWDRAQSVTGGRGRVRLLGQKANKLARMMRASSTREMYRTLMSTDDNPGRFLASAGGQWDPLRSDLESWNGGVSLGDMLASDQRVYLPDDLLQKVDRASMAVSLEVRVPILDHRVVAFSWTLPDHLKVRAGQSKWLLREVLYRHVPRHLVDRPKMGFSVPIAEWLRGPLREWARAHLFDGSASRDEFFDRRAIESTWDEFESGRTELALVIWAIVLFEAWRREWNIVEMVAP
jgi:asparagine synthase (glutamine-hydrolysing)